MLKQRIVTALVLLAILLPALFYDAPEPFCVVALLLIGAGAWEWGRLNGYPGRQAVWIGIDCVALCAGCWAMGWMTTRMPWLWTLATGVWVLAGAWLLRGGVAAWPRIPAALRLVAGLLVLCVTWLAVAQLRVIGINLLLSALVLVWAADIAAYFAGRAFGTRFIARKLAPGISPGKSWEGVIGGAIGVMVLSIAWVWADRHFNLGVPSLYSRLLAKGWWMLLIAALFMTAMSVVGDLVESLVKRAAGVKDSSGLLPGHGGVLDRVDALLPTLPMAMMLVSY